MKYHVCVIVSRRCDLALTDSENISNNEMVRLPPKVRLRQLEELPHKIRQSNKMRLKGEAASHGEAISNRKASSQSKNI